MPLDLWSAVAGLTDWHPDAATCSVLESAAAILAVLVIVYFLLMWLFTALDRAAKRQSRETRSRELDRLRTEN